MTPLRHTCGFTCQQRVPKIYIYIFIIIYLFRLISNTINKKSINKLKIGWKLEEGKKPYHQAPTQLH